jgi:hypothetical protein
MMSTGCSRPCVVAGEILHAVRRRHGKQIQKQLVHETRTLIQFAITVAVFFSGFLIAITPTKTTVVLWGMTVGFHVLNYLLIDLIGRVIRNSWYKWLKASLYLGIALFIPPIIVISVYGNKPATHGAVIALLVVLSIALLMPLVTCCMIFAHFDWLAVRGIYPKLRRRKKKATKSIGPEEVISNPPDHKTIH